MNVKPGQKLYHVERGRGRGSDVTVATVGRKWFTLEEKWRGRFLIETGMVDGCGYTPTARCYESKTIYEEATAAQQETDALWRRLGTYPRPKLTIEQVRAIAAILDAAANCP